MTPYKYQQELDIFLEAQLAAELATRKMLNENPGVWFPCGFSWVKIRPARGRFVDMCKDQGVGHNDSYSGGFTIYNPSGNPTQWMDAKVAGARAFAEVLRKHYPKMSVTVESRVD